jgi:hypothetical protein
MHTCGSGKETHHSSRVRQASAMLALVVSAAPPRRLRSLVARSAAAIAARGKAVVFVD